MSKQINQVLHGSGSVDVGLIFQGTQTDKMCIMNAIQVLLDKHMPNV